MDGWVTASQELKKMSKFIDSRDKLSYARDLIKGMRSSQNSPSRTGEFIADDRATAPEHQRLNRCKLAKATSHVSLAGNVRKAETRNTRPQKQGRETAKACLTSTVKVGTEAEPECVKVVEGMNSLMRLSGNRQIEKARSMDRSANRSNTVTSTKQGPKKKVNPALQENTWAGGWSSKAVLRTPMVSSTTSIKLTNRGEHAKLLLCAQNRISSARWLAGDGSPSSNRHGKPDKKGLKAVLHEIIENIEEVDEAINTILQRREDQPAEGKTPASRTTGLTKQSKSTFKATQTAKAAGKAEGSGFIDSAHVKECASPISAALKKKRGNLLRYERLFKEI